jgi:hypothetical protein
MRKLALWKLASHGDAARSKQAHPLPRLAFDPAGELEFEQDRGDDRR